jgi:hypothetical protein
MPPFCVTLRRPTGDGARRISGQRPFASRRWRCPNWKNKARLKLKGSTSRSSWWGWRMLETCVNDSLLISLKKFMSRTWRNEMGNYRKGRRMNSVCKVPGPLLGPATSVSPICAYTVEVRSEDGVLQQLVVAMTRADITIADVQVGCGWHHKSWVRSPTGGVNWRRRRISLVEPEQKWDTYRYR